MELLATFGAPVEKIGEFTAEHRDTEVRRRMHDSLNSPLDWVGVLTQRGSPRSLGAASAMGAEFLWHDQFDEVVVLFL